MNYIARLTAADGLARRSSQTRKVAIRAVSVDLPPDLHIPIHLAAKRAGVTVEAMILDVLRDAFEPVLPTTGHLQLIAAGAHDTRTEAPAARTAVSGNAAAHSNSLEETG